MKSVILSREDIENGRKRLLENQSGIDDDKNNRKSIKDIIKNLFCDKKEDDFYITFGVGGAEDNDHVKMMRRVKRMRDRLGI